MHLRRCERQQLAPSNHQAPWDGVRRWVRPCAAHGQRGAGQCGAPPDTAAVDSRVQTSRRTWASSLGKDCSAGQAGRALSSEAVANGLSGAALPRTPTTRMTNLQVRRLHLATLQSEL